MTRCTTKAVRKSLGTTLSARVADTTHAAANRLDAIGDGLPTLRFLHHSALDVRIRSRGGPVALAEGIVPGGQPLARYTRANENGPAEHNNNCGG